MGERLRLSMVGFAGSRALPHEYDDPINSETVDAAARLALDLSRQRPDIGMKVHVAEAVGRTFCGCSTTIEDAIEGGASGLHAAILDVVAIRVAEPQADDWDEVDQASADSFPASDP